MDKKLNVEVKGDLLETYIKELLDNGFKVYCTYDKQPITYIFIEKNNNVGYIQNNDFFGLDFSTVHKPNSKTGTGYGLNKDGIEKPTIKHAEETFIFMPHWGSGTHSQDIIKYKSFEEYKKLNTVLKYLEIKEI